MNWNNRRTNWYDSIKPDPASARYKPQPPYLPAELEKHSEIVWNNVRYAKIPKLPSQIRILPREDGQTLFRSVEYIYDRTYSEVQGQTKKTSRNQKVIIGQEVEEILPGWMLPTENYDRFFDREGHPIPREKKETTQEEKQEEKTEKENQTQEESKQDNQTQVKAAEDKPTQEKPTEDKSTEEKPTNTEPNETEANDGLLPGESGRPYYHTAPRSKKQTEKLLTNLMAELSREMAENHQKRLQTMAEKDMTEEERLEYDEIQAREELRRRENRRHALHDLFNPYYHSIEVQAIKHPDTIVSPYKVRKLNQILSTIMDLYRDTEYLKYLELIEEPEKDEQGKPIAGMTYSDINILMNAYEAALSDYHIFN